MKKVDFTMTVRFTRYMAERDIPHFVAGYLDDPEAFLESAELNGGSVDVDAESED